MIYIKLATEDDMERILEIEREAISPPWSHGALLGEIYCGDSFFALAVGGGAILGFAILRRAAGECELLQIAVSSASRRLGAADALMAAAIRWSKENALGSIYLEVRRSNEAAAALYKKHGFKQVSTRKAYYDAPVEDAAIMRKDLTEAK